MDKNGTSACFELAGKQYHGTKNTILYTDLLEGEVNDIVVSDRVLVVDDLFGTPYLENARVECRILKHGKKKKVYLVKFISQKRHKRWKNYRTKYTKLQITDIILEQA